MKIIYEYKQLKIKHLKLKTKKVAFQARRLA